MKSTFIVTLVLTVPNVELAPEEARSDTGMLTAVRRRMGRPLQKLEGRYNVGIEVSCLDDILSSEVGNV